MPMAEEEWVGHLQPCPFVNTMITKPLRQREPMRPRAIEDGASYPHTQGLIIAQKHEAVDAQR
jgi:hypothetical protein